MDVHTVKIRAFMIENRSVEMNTAAARNKVTRRLS